MDMKYRITDTEHTQTVGMDVRDFPEVEKDGVRIAPVAVLIYWRWKSNDADVALNDEGLPVFTVRAMFIGPQISNDGEQLGGTKSLEFWFGSEDFPQGEVSKFIEDHTPWATGGLVPAALRWEEM